MTTILHHVFITANIVKTEVTSVNRRSVQTIEHILTNFTPNMHLYVTYWCVYAREVILKFLNINQTFWPNNKKQFLDFSHLGFLFAIYLGTFLAGDILFNHRLIRD